MNCIARLFRALALKSRFESMRARTTARLKASLMEFVQYEHLLKAGYFSANSYRWQT